MSFRARLLVTFILAVILPMIVLALVIRGEMTTRLTGQYERRVESLIAIIGNDLSQESEALAASITVLRKTIVEDNRFRSAAVELGAQDRRYLLDYAGHAMQLARLSMLQIQDDSGRIISSGHFRNEYDRLEPELPKLLASSSGGSALLQARTPDGHFVALARVDSFAMANRRFTIVAGIKAEQHFLARLARETELTVSLIYPGGTITSLPDVAHPDGGPTSDAGAPRDRRMTTSPSVTESSDAAAPGTIVRDFNFPFIDLQHGLLTDAEIRVTHRLDDLRVLRGSIDRWFLVAIAAAVLLAIGLAGWIASRISRPLVELADKTARIDLDRLDIDFDTNRRDEIGVLSRILGTMTGRLRASAVLIRDAERRATLGELARQVNHDIKNGLTPIRNVFRHLIQLASDDPNRLPSVLEERQGTLDSSMSYLENLASNYARLSPRSERQLCEVNQIVRQVVTDLQNPDTSAVLRTNLRDGAVVIGDPVALRRILENLIDNAIDSLESRPGSVTIETAAVPDDTGQTRVQITIADTGTGLSEDQCAKIFDDFYTTKENGTGLGLSIVRRLVMDLDGSVRVESERNKGSRFVIDLPRAGTQAQ